MQAGQVHRSVSRRLDDYQFVDTLNSGGLDCLGFTSLPQRSQMVLISLKRFDLVLIRSDQGYGLVDALVQGRDDANLLTQKYQ